MTIGTHERPFIAMRNEVSFHAGMRCKFCIANGTTVRSQILVSVQMRLQNAVRSKFPALNRKQNKKKIQLSIFEA